MGAGDRELIAENKELTSKNKVLETEIESLQSKVTNYHDEVERLNHLIKSFKKHIFGSKSERVTEANVEQLVFNEIEELAACKPQKNETETITYKRRKGRQKKQPFPEWLPRKEVVIDVPEEEKICPHDGTRLKQIGFDTTEKLETVPAKSTVIVEKKFKYACPDCEDYLIQGKAPSLLPGTIATPKLISYMIFSKFFQSLPLYRLEELYKLQGIQLSRSTMARWLIQVSEKLMPIWNLLEEWTLDSGYMAIDATSFQVLKEEGRKAKTKSFMWARGSPEKGIILFDYDISGGGEVAKRLVSGFRGGLQADAHRGYNALDKKKMELLGCMMHSRRRFHQAWLQGQKKPGIAAEALKMFNFIYDKEESYRDLTPEERKEWRDKEIAPSLKEIKKWCGWQLDKVVSTSPTGNALNYFINEYNELTAFLKNGHYEIDNGWIERVIKRFAVGRKNWLFSDTVEGAHASSLLYSLALTAKLNGKDPFKVMTEILKKLPEAQTAEDYEKLALLLLSEVDIKSCRKKEGALIE